jgi:hypothetical protein
MLFLIEAISKKGFWFKIAAGPKDFFEIASSNDLGRTNLNYILQVMNGGIDLFCDAVQGFGINFQQFSRSKFIKIKIGNLIKSTVTYFAGEVIGEMHNQYLLL